MSRGGRPRDPQRFGVRRGPACQEILEGKVAALGQASIQHPEQEAVLVRDGGRRRERPDPDVALRSDQGRSPGGRAIKCSEPGYRP